MKWYFAFLLAGITLPFVLTTSIYPFYRFGMFAEPKKVDEVAVSYELWDEDKAVQIRGPEIGINAKVFQSIVEKHTLLKHYTKLNEGVLTLYDNDNAHLAIYKVELDLKTGRRIKTPMF